MISASKLSRISVCPASEALPHSPHETDHAVVGTLIHAFLEDATKRGRDRALTDVAEDVRAFCEAIDLSQLPTDPSQFASEVAFAVNAQSGNARELGRGLDRRYSELAPSEIPGTADIVGIAGDSVYIADFKTGHSAVPARNNLQLKFLAFAACRVYGLERAIVELLHLRSDGHVWRDRAQFDLFDLDDFAIELKRIFTRVAHARAVIAQSGTVQTSSGSHCRYCPAFASCPSQTALVRVMAHSPEQVDHDIRSQLTPESAALAWERLKQAEAVVDRVRRAIYAYAEQSPITLANGSVLGPVETKRETLDGMIVRDVLREMATTDVADAACAVEASKASVQRALRPVAEALGQPLRPMLEKVLAEVRSRGGISIKTSVSVREKAA